MNLIYFTKDAYKLLKKDLNLKVYIGNLAEIHSRS